LIGEKPVYCLHPEFATLPSIYYFD
jgi:hypothetical protein